MATITDDDLKMFQERAKTEFASRCDTGGIAWDSVIWDLCNEVRRLRSVSTERGDCAKLRKALIDVVKRLEAYAGCDHHTFHPTATTCDGITSIGKCGKIGTCAAIFKAHAALAATEKEGGAK